LWERVVSNAVRNRVRGSDLQKKQGPLTRLASMMLATLSRKGRG